MWCEECGVRCEECGVWCVEWELGSVEWVVGRSGASFQLWSAGSNIKLI